MEKRVSFKHVSKISELHAQVIITLAVQKIWARTIPGHVIF